MSFRNFPKSFGSDEEYRRVEQKLEREARERAEEQAKRPKYTKVETPIVEPVNEEPEDYLQIPYRPLFPGLDEYIRKRREIVERYEEVLRKLSSNAVRNLEVA